MTINRRDFVSGAGGVLLATCLPAAAMAASRSDGVAMPTFDAGLSKSLFEALVSQDFYVTTAQGGVMVLQLVALKDGASTKQGRVHTEGFTAYFRGVATPTLAEGIYVLEHGAAGTVALYLEPTTVTDLAATYRAQFCLLT